MTKRIDADGFARTIMDYDNIMILTHSHPDGDTVGTAIGLLDALTSLGKSAVVVCTDVLPEHIRFIESYAPSEKCYFGTFTTEKFYPEKVVSVDIAAAYLVGTSLSEYMSRVDLALDHHDTNTLECPLLFVEERSSSAGETMYFAIKELEKHSGKKLIDKNCACALYSAISSDSGNFKYTCTTARTMRVAGELIELGAENGNIARQLFDIKTLGVFKAEALCTENITFYHDGKIVFSYMNRADAEKRGIVESEFETCVQLLRMIKGVEIAVFAKEKNGDDGIVKYRLSMRSNEYVDVAELCAEFGGGGHMRAAGCTVEGELCDVIKKVIAAAEKVL